MKKLALIESIKFGMYQELGLRVTLVIDMMDGFDAQINWSHAACCQYMVDNNVEDINLIKGRHVWVRDHGLGEPLELVMVLPK